VGVLDAIRQRLTPQGPPVEMPVGPPQFVDGLRYGARANNPYRHDVEADTRFPKVRVDGKRFMPPSVQPRILIRLGSTPDPTGPTVPPNAVHPKGSK
jgi:hypothetical protein